MLETFRLHKKLITTLLSLIDDLNKKYYFWKLYAIKDHYNSYQDFGIDWIADFNSLEERYEGEEITFRMLENYAKKHNIEYKQDLIDINLESYIMKY